MTEVPTGSNAPHTLITGATGFVGSYLLRHLLKRGYPNLRAVRRRNSSTELLGTAERQVEWIEGDITDPVFVEEAMKGVKWVFHCAGLVSFDPGKTRHMMRTNGEGTANVVNAALHEGIDKLLHVSSISTLGRIRDGMRLSENDFWQRSRFNTNYAISKYLAEQEVWRGMAEGLSVVAVNPSIILGSGSWNEGTARIFKMIAEGTSFYPAGASGFVDVRDVARFSAQLMESEVEGQRFILNAENLSYQSLFETISRHLGARPPAYKATPLARGIAWRLARLYSWLAGQPPALTREMARQSSHTFYYDNQKSLQVFPFSYYPIEKTIADTCRQLLEAKEEGFPAKVLPFGEKG